MSTLKVLFFAGITVVAMLVLAGSLSNLELLPGDPALLKHLLHSISQKLSLGQIEGWETTTEGKIIIVFLKAVFTITLVGLPFAIIYFIISPEFRKLVIKRIIRMSMIVVVVFLVARFLASLKNFFERGNKTPGPAFSFEAEPTWKPFTEFALVPSQWLIFFSDVVFALLLASLLGYVICLVRRRHHSSTQPLTELAGVAQNAINMFQAGGDFKNTVMRCYVEMSQALEERRGIRRQETMTPREFETYLSNVGLPHKPIQQLTRIFEEVRYGTKTPSKDEERQAIASLAAIIEACKNSC